MNSSYKIALAASFAVCVLVIGYYTMQRRNPPQVPINTELADASATSSRTAANTGTSTGPASAYGSTAGSRPAIAPSLPNSLNPGTSSSSGVLPGTTSPRQPAPGPAPDRFSTSLPPAGAGASGVSAGVRDDLRAINPDRPARASSGDSASGSSRYKSYTIKPGDNFHTLAKRLYGAERFWIDIAQANPKVDPVRLKVGQVIRLPASGDDRSGDGTSAAAPSSGSTFAPADRPSTTATPDSAPASTGSGTKHTVRSGETLGTIAKRYYGSTAKWEVILRANRDQLDDPRQLQPGMTLTIPPQR